MATQVQTPPIKVEVSGSGYVRWPEGKDPNTKDGPIAAMDVNKK